MVRVIEGKIIWKRSERTQKLLRVSGRFELSMVKLQLMYEGNPGEIDFGSIELARGSSYRGSRL